MSTELFIFFVIAIFFAYQLGKIFGSTNESRRCDLEKLMDAETDPEKKTKMLLEWNELDSSTPKYLKNNFKKLLQKKK